MRNTTLTTPRIKFQTVILTALLSVVPLSVGAAGLGKITVLSALGQPLRAEVDITASPDELASLSARVPSAAAFKEAGIEYSPALGSVRLAIERTADGRPFLSMASGRPINEPFLDLLVELNWNSGRLVREYTFLLDPPGSQQRPASQVAVPVTPPVVASSAAPMATPAPVQAAPQIPAGTPAVRDVPAPEEKPQQRPEMKIVRGADGGQRIVKAERAAPAKHGGERLVKHGDTLSQIAVETKPEGVNLDQMLIALFRSNQDAFEGNVNRLKAGKILAIPDDEAAASVDPQEATRTVLAHAADFDAYRKKLASSVANAASQKDDVPKRAVSGKIAPKVEDKLPPVASGKDKLEVSKSEVAGGGAAKAGAGRLAAIEETLIAREKALKEANSRIAELEKNLNDLKKLIELKNQGMAQLQANAAKPAGAPTPPPAAAEIKKPEVPAEAAPAKSADKVADADKKPAQPAPPKPAEAKRQPAPPASAAKPTPPEPSFIDQSPEIVYGGAGILALLLFYFGYKRYQQRNGSKPVRADSREPFSASAMGRSGVATIDSDNLLVPNDFSNLSSMGGGDGDAGVDPIAEADVYLAYGRDVQAEEILLDALKTDPKRHAIHVKLLEIYANRKSTKQFESIANDLHHQTSGAGPDWEKAASLGREIDPSNPLYGSAPPAAKDFDPDATMVLKPEDRQIDFGDLDMAGTREELPPLATIAEEQPAEETPGTAPQEEVPASLDFELDLAEPEPAAAAPSLVAPAAPAASEEVSGIDFELNAEMTDAANASLKPALGDPTLPEAASAAPDFDLDLDLGPAASAESIEAVSPATKASDDAGAGLDFNFDLDAGEPAVPAPAQAPDGNSIDFDLDVPVPEVVPEAPQPTASGVDLSSISLDLNEPLKPVTPTAPPKAAELDDAASQDVETKLELAQAYEEMGDKEGARELLQEVLAEGNATQKESARSKLDRLG